MNICLFANDDVGVDVAQVFADNLVQPIILILDRNNKYNQSIIDVLEQPENAVLYSDHLYYEDTIDYLIELEIDLSILGWWHEIIREPVLSIPKIGHINFHPSYLPYNRGKHYYFWNIIDGTQFGVSLHMITSKIDDGDIVFQKKINTTVEDTGFSLREKAKKEIVELFRSEFKSIISGNYKLIKQDLEKGNYHNANELEIASKIDFSKSYIAQDLINLIRARSGFEKGGAWFEVNGKQYEISLAVREKDK